MKQILIVLFSIQQQVWNQLINHKCNHEEAQSKVKQIDYQDSLQTHTHQHIRDLLKNKQYGRKLTAQSQFQDQFRIKIMYDSSFSQVPIQTQQIVKDNLMPFIERYLKGLILQTFSTRNYDFSIYSAQKGYKCEGFELSQEMTNQIQTDDLYLIVGSFESNYLSEGKICIRDNGRPLVALILIKRNLNMIYYTTPSNIHNILHNMIHILGFSKSSFTHFKTTSNIISNITIRNKKTEVIRSNSLLQFAKSHFGCQDLEGVELEDEVNIGSHWDLRLVQEDIMTIYYSKKHGITNFTISVLEDSGWYRMNRSLAFPAYFGKEVGCKFIKDNCINNINGIYNTISNDFCVNRGQPYPTKNHQECGICGRKYPYTQSQLPSYFDYFGNKASVNYLGYDNCPSIIESQDCTRSQSTLSQNNPQPVFGYDSKCIEGTFTKIGYQATKLQKCLRTRCIVSILRVYIDTTDYVDCLFRNQRTNLAIKYPNKWTGYLYCPDPVSVCNLYGKIKYQLIDNYNYYPYQYQTMPRYQIINPPADKPKTNTPDTRKAFNFSSSSNSSKYFNESKVNIAYNLVYNKLVYLIIILLILQ